MKLYQVSNKHDTISKELDLGELTERDKALLSKVLGFVNQGLTRYQQYEVAENCQSIRIDPNEDFPILVFDDSLDTMKYF